MEFKEPTRGVKENENKTNSQENSHIREELEKRIPGSVKLLQEKYGIEEFHRYPIEVLCAQVQQEEEQLPYGLMILLENDPNGAFSRLQGAILNLYRKLQGHYTLKVAESGSKLDLAKKFISLDTKYGEKNKIEFLFLGGHGLDNGEGLMLGEYDIEIPRETNPQKQNAIWNEESGALAVKKISEKYLDKDAEIIFLSCSTGTTGGIANTFSVSLDRKTTAPVIFVQLSNLDIRVSYDEKNKPHFKTIFQNEEALSAVYGQKPPAEENKESTTENSDYF
jgi:hypothetical protein